MTKKTDIIYIQDGNEVKELSTEEKKIFLEDAEKTRLQRQLLEAEYKKKEEARKSALEKLAEIAGLTKDEMAALGL